MSGQIFISYRRDDAGGHAGRLYDHLSARFRRNRVFMDVGTIPLGFNFVDAIEKSVGSCDVLLAVIGKDWISAADEQGNKRLDNPDDIVRIELGTALRRRIRVIPVLVGRSLMPRAGELPDDLKPLVRLNAHAISDNRFQDDSERLIKAVKQALKDAQTERESPRKVRELWWLLVVLTSCLLGFYLFEATRPQSVSVDKPSAPVMPDAPSNSLSPTPRGGAIPLRSLDPVISSPSSVIHASRSPTLSGADWFAEAKSYLDVMDYAKALPLLTKAAEVGNADAMNRLGSLYEKGQGVAQDYAQARQWFQKAADKGDGSAMNHLGELYKEGGPGLAQDNAQARAWYQKAADKGDAEAMYKLGQLYWEGGPGLAQDYAEAREWYQKAAEAGNAVGMNKLGYLYRYGLGVAQDYAQAREWFQKAADKGDAEAMNNSGTLYRDGRGVAQDYAQARQWYQRAAGRGNAKAINNLKTLIPNPPVTIGLAGENSFGAGSLGENGQWTKACAQDWAQKTGNILKYIDRPHDSSATLRNFQADWATKRADVDVYMIDVTWPAIAAPYSVDLKKYFTEGEIDQHFPRIIENNTVDGRLVGMPFFTDVGLLYYRTDLLEKYGYKEPPQTWQELAQMAKKIQDNERQGGQPNFQGFVFEGTASESLTCNALEWIYSFDGGTVINPDKQVTIDNPNAIRALETARSWIGTISEVDVTTYGEEEARNIWQSGNAAFMRNWPYAYKLGQDPKSPIAGKFSLTVLPRDRYKGKNTTCFGGWQLMVSKYSKHPEVAADLVRYLCSAEVQKRRAIERLQLPTRPGLYWDREILAALPWIANAYHLLVLLDNAVARPSKVTGINYARLSKAIFQNVNRVLSGEESATDAVEKIKATAQSLVH
jgi:trehalose/maltose transport system substrate-binding protein